MIPLFRPLIDVPGTLALLKPVLESGWLGLGPKTAEFEQKCARAIGAKHFIATSSCTAALQLAVRVLDLPPESLVLSTPITFVSTNAVLVQAGHLVGFCDVEPRTGNLDAKLLGEAIAGHRPAAVMVVHLGGYSAEMEAINYHARRAGIPVIEDCAHAFGARYRGRPVGDTDNLCCWSFHAVKNLPLGDGGGVSTNDDELAARLCRLRWLGISASTADRSQPGGGYSWEYSIDELGYKSHMNDVAAAIGLAGLCHVERHNARRRQIAARYLAEVRCIQPAYDPWIESSFHFLPLFFEDRAAVIERLRAAGIQFGMHYRPNYDYAPFARPLGSAPLAGAAWYAEHELTLPLHAALSDAEQEAVVAAVNAQ